MSTIRILSENTVKHLLAERLDEAFHACADAYRYYGRVGSVLSEPSSMFLTLPTKPEKKCRLKGAHLGDAGAAGFRLASPGSYYNWVLDVQTGEPKGLVAENWLHRRRTAVTGALILSWLRPKLDRIALIGAGHIGNEFAITLGHAFPKAELVLGSRDPGRGQRFVSQLTAELGQRFLVESIEKAVRSCEAVITITKADRAFVEGDWLNDQSVALSMGGVPEFTFSTWSRCNHFILDDLDYALKQGDLHHWVKSDGLTAVEIEQKLTGTVGQLALDPKSFNEQCKGITLAVIQGMAICDVALAALALKFAQAQNAGHCVDLSSC